MTRNFLYSLAQIVLRSTEPRSPFAEMPVRDCLISTANLTLCFSGSMFSPPVIVMVESPKVWFSQPKVRLLQARH